MHSSILDSTANFIQRPMPSILNSVRDETPISIDLGFVAKEKSVHHTTFFKYNIAKVLCYRNFNNIVDLNLNQNQKLKQD